jgi:hypothetical protein
LNCDQKRSSSATLPIYILACLVFATAPAFPEGSAAPLAEKWRPKNGTYAEPGTRFNARCGKFGDTQIEWAKKSINGGEEGCEIDKVSDTAPGSIKLDVLCTNSDTETPYREIILLKRVNDKTIFIRETQNGKFARDGGQMTYCPESAQRLYVDSEKKRGR